MLAIEVQGTSEPSDKIKIKQLMVPYPLLSIQAESIATEATVYLPMNFRTYTAAFRKSSLVSFRK